MKVEPRPSSHFTNHEETLLIRPIRRPLILLALLALLAVPASAQIFYSEDFTPPVTGINLFNDGETSNAWEFTAGCPGNALAGHSGPDAALWHNPANCTDYGIAGGSDRMATGRIQVPSECRNGVEVTFNYLLDFDEDACWDRARVEIEVNAGGFFDYADNGGCDNRTIVGGPRDGEAPSGQGANSGVGGLINDAVWHQGRAVLSTAVPGDLVEVAFVGETEDGIGNDGEGFFVDDLELACVPVTQEIPTVGPIGLAALAVLLAVAAALVLARRRFAHRA